MAAVPSPVVLPAGEQLAANTAAIDLLTSTLDTLWIIVGSIFVFFMQVGAASLSLPGFQAATPHPVRQRGCGSS